MPALTHADDPKPAIPHADRVRLAEAFRLADKLGNKVWPNWDKAPFATLLVTQDREFLLRHPKPTSDFTALGEDEVLKEKVWVRPRKFSPAFLATFPAVGGVPTIVIGQAENTEAVHSSRWVITLLHEHFHQLQYSQPRYYAAVDSLNLARGDKSGMWMLNYPFPYGEGGVKAKFAAMSKALGAALAARDQPGFDEKLTAYLDARKAFRTSIKPDDWKYLAFQFWQEGIARYTECRLLELAVKDYEPSPAFAALKDFKPFKEVAAEVHRRIENELVKGEIEKPKRVVVYNFGAAEGLILDRWKPNWRKKYLDEPYSLDALFR